MECYYTLNPKENLPPFTPHPNQGECPHGQFMFSGECVQTRTVSQEYRYTGS